MASKRLCSQRTPKKGIGSNLIKHITQLAKEQGSNKLYLRTEDKEDFYKTLSWITLEKLTSDGEATNIMYFEL